MYVPSSDHDDIWQGHSSIIYELKAQLQDNPPAAIICPVGGGGLLNGVIIGLQEVDWKEVPVIAVETHGSNAFQASVVAGKLVNLQKITTIASSLASETVCAKSLELSLIHPVVPFAVSDAMAADAVRQFAGKKQFCLGPLYKHDIIRGQQNISRTSQRYCVIIVLYANHSRHFTCIKTRKRCHCAYYWWIRYHPKSTRRIQKKIPQATCNSKKW